MAEEERLVKLAKQGKLVEKVEKKAPEKGPGVRTFNVFVDNDYYEVEVEEVGGAPVVTSVTAAAVAAPPPPAAGARPRLRQRRPAAKAAPAPAAAPAPTNGGTPSGGAHAGHGYPLRKAAGEQVTKAT